MTTRVESSMGIGLSLEGDSVAVATCSCPSPSAATLVRGGQMRLPPSALVPRLPGEPIRADFLLPAHLRGSGQPSPAEAAVGDGAGAGRFPLAYAWSLLAAGAKTMYWHWKHGLEELSAFQAIGAVAAAVAAIAVEQAEAAEPVLIIPDHLTGAAQQELVDRAADCGRRVRLLWRPVAAVSGFCEQRQAQLIAGPIVDDQPLGKVLSLHVGLDCFELSLLEVVPQRDPDGQIVFLPARKRPVVAPLAGIGTMALEHLTARVLEACSCKNDASTWGLLWSYPWVPVVLDHLRHALSEEDLAAELARHGLPGQLLKRTRSYWSDVVAKGAVSRFKLSSIHSLGLTAAIDWRQWVQEQTIELLKDQESHMLGAVVTGPFADVHVGDLPFSQYLLSSVRGVLPYILTEGIEIPRGVLARSASAYSTRFHRGWPTYLDTLPRVRVVVQKRGQPAWQNLLQDEEKYWPGGKRFTRTGVGEDHIFIPAGESALAIDLHHEEHPTVRKSHHAFKPCNDNMPISLDVSVMPAQGHVQIVVQPKLKDFFGLRMVVVKWSDPKCMKETGMRDEEYLDSLPRTVPPHSPRLSSKLLWSGGQDLWGHHIGGSAAHVCRYMMRSTETSLLPKILKALQMKDNTQPGGECTAVDSEGIPGIPTDKELLDRFTRSLVSRLPRTRGEDRELFVRLCGWSSCSNPDFIRNLIDELSLQGVKLEQHYLTACGWCLREPEHIRELASAMCQVLRNEIGGPNNWIKAFWELVRYRPEASEKLDSDLCLTIVKHLLRIVREEMAIGKFKFKFRYASGGIAYLLRRRMYDPSYFDPTIPLAMETKESFRDAMRSLKAHPENGIGGFVNLDDQLGIVITYIDKQGRGPLYI